MRASFVFLFFGVFPLLESKHPSGHLEPLGSHQPPIGLINITDAIPSPQDFFQQYVLPGVPLLFKDAAKKMPAYSKWTDKYLSEKFGQVSIDVEEGKKENRSLATFQFKLQDFIKRYKNEDIYMVESLPVKMREEYALLKSMSCGGYTNVLQDAVVWFSSGGTKSVLHYDAVDNINCLFDGTKELLMINKSLLNQSHIDKTNGAFSSVDVDKVDMYKYPDFQTIPYYKAFMEPGDCLFIPSKWIHQVRSYGSRNLAVNIWWAHFVKFNTQDCEESPYTDKDLIPLSDFEFHPQEAIRHSILETIGEKPLTFEEWISMIQEDASSQNVSLIPTEQIFENFQEIDKDNDGYVSANEIYDIPHDDLERLLGYFSEEEGEMEEDSEGGGTEDLREEISNDETEEHAHTKTKEDIEHTEL